MIKVQSQEHMKKERSLTDIYLKDLDRFKRDHDTFVTAILLSLQFKICLGN